MLSGNTTKGEIAYGVIAGLIWLTWVAISTASHFKSRGHSKGGIAESPTSTNAIQEDKNRNGNGA